MRALPEPTSGTATWDDLFTVVNVDPITSRSIAGGLPPMIRSLPHPVLNVNGPQGTAKSTMARITTRLIDPCAVESLSPPKDAESWSTLVSARWVPNIDNVSRSTRGGPTNCAAPRPGQERCAASCTATTTWWPAVLRSAVIINGITMAGARPADLAERTCRCN